MALKSFITSKLDHQMSKVEKGLPHTIIPKPNNSTEYFYIGT